MTDAYSMFGMGPAAQAASDDPEAFQLLQQERNRQMLASLLLSRGQQPPQGQMVGRFYVPPSPLQHAGNLASTGLGAYMMGQQGQGLAGLAERRNEARKQALEQYIRDTSPEQIPARTLPQGSPEQTIPLEGPPVPDTERLHGLAPAPMKHPTLTIPAVPAVEGPVHEAQTIPPDPMKARRAIMEALTHNDPRVRESVKFLEQQRQAEELKREDQAVRREGIIENANTRMATIANTMAMKEMQLAQMEREGLRDETAKKRHDDLTKSIADDRREMEKWRAKLDADTKLAIAGMKGDPAAQKRQDKAEEAQTSVNMAINTLSNTRDKAKELLNHKGLWRITGPMGVLPNMPGSEAANAEAMLDQLKAMASVQMINDLRQASKTGGAVGQVTEREWGYLQNAAARLQKTQGTAAFKDALEDYVKQLDRVETLIQEAYGRQFGGASTPPSPAPTAPSGGSGGWGIKKIQ